MSRSLTPRSRRLPAVLAAALLIICALTALAPETSAAQSSNVTSGSLAWGFKASFRSYVVGPIADGAIATESGAVDNGNGTYGFAATGGTHDVSSTFASFSGAVHFTGHDGALDLTVTDLKVQINGSTGVLLADVASKSLQTGELIVASDASIATLDLSGATPTTSGNTVSWSGIAATLSDAGAPAFAGFYTAGTALDPLSMTLTVEQPSSGTTNTAAPQGTGQAQVPANVPRSGGPLESEGPSTTLLSVTAVMVALAGAAVVAVPAARRRSDR